MSLHCIVGISKSFESLYQKYYNLSFYCVLKHKNVTIPSWLGHRLSFSSEQHFSF